MILLRQRRGSTHRMSKRSRREKQQARRADVTQFKDQIQQHAPSAIPAHLVAQIIQQTTEYRGPIPPPELLAQYTAVIPNGAARIFERAEKQSDHRMAMELIVIQGGSRRSWWGLILGFLTTLVIAGVGLTVALVKSPAAGATIISSTIVSLAAVFVYGQWSRREERTKKAGLMTGQRES